MRERSLRRRPLYLAALVVFGTLWAARGSADDAKRPDPVLSWRHVILKPADYERLAREWKDWTDRNPRDVRGLVELGNALRYSGKSEEATEAYARAFRTDSTDAAALSAIASQRWTARNNESWELSHDRLIRAMKADPGYAGTYYNLWLTSLRQGDAALADTCLERTIDLGDMTRPLIDYGYNMLAGAPPDAIILTNGDNDTYPPLAVQAKTGFRKDVRIVNLSLLNMDWYIRKVRDAGVPLDLTDAEIDSLRPTQETPISTLVQRALAAGLAKAKQPAPLFYAVTVPEWNRAMSADYSLEGLLARVLPAGGCKGRGSSPCLDLERTRALFDTEYRLDSATDPLLDWKREGAAAWLATNYASLLAQVGDSLISASGPGDPYLEKAVTILAFHKKAPNAEQAGEKILQSWEEKEPSSEALVRAKRRFAEG